MKGYGGTAYRGSLWIPSVLWREAALTRGDFPESHKDALRPAEVLGGLRGEGRRGTTGQSAPVLISPWVLGWEGLDAVNGGSKSGGRGGAHKPLAYYAGGSALIASIFPLL